jgi:D-sedoheptulose 7-phosphate isomerase
MHDDDTALVRRTAREAGAVLAAIADHASDVARIIQTVRTCLNAGGCVLTCGNGGSAAEAMHLAEELIGRYKADRPPYRALCLNADATALTCIANDFGYDAVFARQVAGLARQGDCLIVLSTSGNSPNIVRALDEARSRDVTTIALLGKTGGDCLPRANHALVVPSDATERIQEAHLLVIHQLLEALEGGVG